MAPPFPETFCCAPFQRTPHRRVPSSCVPCEPTRQAATWCWSRMPSSRETLSCEGSSCHRQVHAPSSCAMHHHYAHAASCACSISTCTLRRHVHAPSSACACTHAHARVRMAGALFIVPANAHRPDEILCCGGSAMVSGASRADGGLSARCIHAYIHAHAHAHVPCTCVSARARSSAYTCTHMCRHTCTRAYMGAAYACMCA